jgi:uncharacterized protein YgfB (UPF0149 family)
MPGQRKPDLHEFDPENAGAIAPDFDDCANALLEAGTLLSPSEMHGALAGILAGGFTGDAAETLAALEKTLDDTLSGPAAEVFEQLHAQVARELSSGELAFAPLLPDEALELPQRVVALAAWCRGFLGGYAQARVSLQSADRPVAADSAEVLRDFAAIAQATVAESESRAEAEFEELAAYIGVAAVRVMADSAATFHAATEAAAKETRAAVSRGSADSTRKPH